MLYSHLGYIYYTSFPLCHSIIWPLFNYSAALMPSLSFTLVISLPPVALFVSLSLSCHLFHHIFCVGFFILIHYLMSSPVVLESFLLGWWITLWLSFHVSIIFYNFLATFPLWPKWGISEPVGAFWLLKLSVSL